ncbi:hypothetical protein V1525DRAFT_451450 [Lipomyces kononenkoae]|uniref:Uncharacterized protein n=1 Tax=Lipomyces kononenkoae TaxID=34357 RepID=A0ACC3SY30_LIPKO
MSMNRAPWSNVHFYDACTGATLGGFYQQGSLTEATMVWIVWNWIVRHRSSGRTIRPSSKPFVPGDYDVYSKGTVRVSDEPHSVSGREDAFREGVRARDGKCVISDVWAGFQDAHSFPLEYESLWIQDNCSRWITNMDSAVESSKINSLQNGLLMSENLHTVFDQYLFSVNPDVEILDPICRDPDSPDHVSDDVLRWHFRQCTDFPAGTDMMATLRTELYGKERLEMELESRLRFIPGEG